MTGILSWNSIHEAMPGRAALEVTVVKKLTILILMSLLLTMTPALAAKGGKPGGGGGKQAEYTAALISGGFEFDAVDVTPQKKGNIFNNNSQLTMDRPDENNTADKTTWDGVFDACMPASLLSNPVYTVFVGAGDWEITNSGGKAAGTAGSDVRIRFHNIIDETADIDFDLIGELDFDGQFLPEPGLPSVITLTQAKIYAADNENHQGCNSGEFNLIPHSVSLKICHKYDDGSGCP
jgi:hypothetical protein